MTFIGSHKFCVFVPTFAPQYRAMVARGGLPGISAEDETRHGVWVPLSWLDSSTSKKDTWQRMSDDDMRMAYPPKPEPQS